MSRAVMVRTYKDLPFDERAALRYAGCRTSDEEVAAVLRGCAEEALPRLTYAVCYRTVPITVEEEGKVAFPFVTIQSHSLWKHLLGCRAAVLFGATVGLELDRMMVRAGAISPMRALCFQAIGTERIEAVCDAFELDMQDMYGSIRTRFSPGYGDLPLTCQRDLFRALDGGRAIGLTLHDSLLMSPTKSVTAVIGVESLRQ